MLLWDRLRLRWILDGLLFWFSLFQLILLSEMIFTVFQDSRSAGARWPKFYVLFGMLKSLPTPDRLLSFQPLSASLDSVWFRKFHSILLRRCLWHFHNYYLFYWLDDLLSYKKLLLSDGLIASMIFRRTGPFFVWDRVPLTAPSIRALTLYS